MSDKDQVWLEGADGGRLPFSGNCSVGRGGENSIIVTGEKVSRRHALIHAQNQAEFWLVDLGSRNGTFRNGRPIKQPTQLLDRDTIEIGPVKFIFRVERSAISEEAFGELPETIATERFIKSWLLLVDLENFTVLCRTLSSEELGRHLGAWLLACSEVIEKSGGSVDKYVGDGFLAYWPVTRDSEDGIIAALQELEKLKRNPAYAFRWVLHRAGLRLRISRFGNESLIGSDINFVFRMEKLAGALKVDRMLSAPAAEGLSGKLMLRELGEHPVKGFDQNFSFYSIPGWDDTNTAGGLSR